MKTILKKSILILLTVLSMAPIANAAIKYGEAVVKQGDLVVVRNGRLFHFTQANNPVTIYENDTIRTLKNSSLTLHNPDQNRIRLGSNAIMQVKKWQKSNQTGMVRALFGKFRARTASIRKKSLNLRTATATIGIKGSLGDLVTDSNQTTLANLAGQMSMYNNRGNEFNIPLGQFGYNVDGLNQDINLEDNPEFVEGEDEEAQESANTEELDNEDPKDAEAPPVVEEAVEQEVVEVTSVETDAVPEPTEETPDQDLQDTVEDIIEDAEEAASQAYPKAKVKITFED